MPELAGNTILIIAEDREILAQLRDILSAAGARVCAAPSGEESARRCWSLRPDLVVLEVPMSRSRGWETFTELQALQVAPIVLVSAFEDDNDVIRGLSSGAVDCVSMACNPKVLFARAQAALRRGGRAPSSAGPVRYDDGYLLVQLEEGRVRVQGQPVKMSRTEYRLFTYLFRNANCLVPYANILRSVWGEAYEGSHDYVHVYVRRLRKKLEPDPASPRYIVAEFGLGYRFVLSPQASGQPPA